MFFRGDRANRAIQIKQVVKLKDEMGWLMEDHKGQIHGAGSIEKRLTANCYIVNVAAEAGSAWGNILEGLVALKKISKEHLEEHRKVMGKHQKDRERRNDLKYAEDLCAKHGWKLDTGAPAPAVDEEALA
ncbi:hypothetical protein [Paracoccus litorisediminis]|uniref:Uncharacterized protein n=1 Tax=Paracoccus litorisediminis TaxID=2006130 RepID=A0A844HSG1_9RHOB|nr:hypothetical protein [Paracoccus litorisediminis]MTH61145.1 hypothetical protein [Paracoccus litorisediminis]